MGRAARGPGCFFFRTVWELHDVRGLVGRPVRGGALFVEWCWYQRTRALCFSVVVFLRGGRLGLGSWCLLRVGLGLASDVPPRQHFFLIVFHLSPGRVPQAVTLPEGLGACAGVGAGAGPGWAPAGPPWPGADAVFTLSGGRA